MAIILLAWLKVWLWPVFLVWRVWIFLTFEANRHLLRIFDAVLAADACALEVAGIYLYARLVGVHLKEDAGNRRIKCGANLSVVALTVLICVKTPVVVVTGSILYLLECSVNDSLLYGVWLAEVHRGSFYRSYLACCHIGLVGWCVVVSINI